MEPISQLGFCINVKEGNDSGGNQVKGHSQSSLGGVWVPPELQRMYERVSRICICICICICFVFVSVFVIACFWFPPELQRMYKRVSRICVCICICICFVFVFVNVFVFVSEANISVCKTHPKANQLLTTLLSGPSALYLYLYLSLYFHLSFVWSGHLSSSP